MKRTRVEWFRIFADMLDKGVSLRNVSEETGIPRTTLLEWKGGREPRHHDGEVILSMWERVMGKSREEVPTMRLYPSIRVYRKSSRARAFKKK